MTLKKQVAKLTSDLAAKTKFVHLLYPGTTNSNVIQRVAQPSFSHKEVGFVSSSKWPLKTVFVPHVKPDEQMF